MISGGRLISLTVTVLMLTVVTGATSAGDCEECDKTVAVLFEFNDGRWAWADVLVPEPANAWCATVIAADKLDLDLKYSFSEFGVFLEGIDGVDTPEDFSRYWGLWTWDTDALAWETSMEGALDVDVDNDTVIAWSFLALGDPAPSPTPTTRNPWLSFRGGWQVSGYTNTAGPLAGGFFWAEDLGNGPIDSTLAVADGKVFGITAGIYDWNAFEFVHLPTVFALDLQSGQLVWEHEFQGSRGFEIGSPAYHGGVVYATSSGRTVMALDADDGTLLWETEMDGDGLSSSPTVADGKVLLGTGGGKLVALDTGSGDEMWSANVSGRVYLAAPTVHEGVVYIGTDNHTLHAVSLENGTEMWAVDLGGRLRGTPLVHQDRIYVISGTYMGFVPLEGYLHALDMEGKEQWNVTIDTTSSSPTILGDLVLVGSTTGLHAFTAAGAKSWTYADAGKISSSPAVTLHKTYVLSNENNSEEGLHSSVLALDPLGNLIWSRTLEPHNWALSSVAIADGRIFVASDNGWVYSIGETPLEARFDNRTEYLRVNLTANETAVGVEVIEYTWHIEGSQSTLEGREVTYEFPKAGTYTVSLRIVDQFGRVTTTEDEVTVEDEPPTVDDSQLNVGAALTVAFVGMVAVVAVAIVASRWG